jgi:hypothetical protein
MPNSRCLVVPYKMELVKGTFRGSIVSIIESNSYNPISGNLNRKFIGRGYAKITKDECSTIVYADYDDNVRSISEISYKYRDDELSDYCFLSDDIRAFIDKWADFYF